MSGANAPTDILASEMKRDPAFALAVGSLERCLRVRERVGSSRPPGSGGFDAAVCGERVEGSLCLILSVSGTIRFLVLLPLLRLCVVPALWVPFEIAAETDFKGKLSWCWRGPVRGYGDCVFCVCCLQRPTCILWRSRDCACYCSRE